MYFGFKWICKRSQERLWFFTHYKLDSPFLSSKFNQKKTFLPHLLCGSFFSWFSPDILIDCFEKTFCIAIILIYQSRNCVPMTTLLCSSSLVNNDSLKCTWDYYSSNLNEKSRYYINLEKKKLNSVRQCERPSQFQKGCKITVSLICRNVRWGTLITAAVSAHYTISIIVNNHMNVHFHLVSKYNDTDLFMAICPFNYLPAV